MPIRVVTVGSTGAVLKEGRFAKTLFGVKVYEAKPKKSGGWSWRLVGKIGGSYSTEKEGWTAAQTYAKKARLPYAPKIKQGTEALRQPF